MTERKRWQLIAEQNGICKSTYDNRIRYQKMSYEEAATKPKMIPGRLKDGTYRSVEG